MPRLTEEIRSMIGLETEVQRCCDVVERGAVRRYAQAVMDRDPIYMDPEFAAATRYRTPVAPPLFPSAMLRLPFGAQDLLHERCTDPDFDGVVGSSSFGLPPLPLVNSPIVNGGTEVEFIRYVNHGEEIFLIARYKDITERETKAGWALFVQYECDFVDRDHQLVLRYRRVQIRR
ncbi:acyl dehydratase [Paraburkholderia silvatlantica]|uniref:Acyl dehydratase n=1 Tax=Paraburkholderia silvatlantica TaxID=321895 RepID=A0A2V4TJ05_9BURK|nr:MaoC family dehydratase N-terminal domain-containing protein [Paraburkholderia silvatlantica]PYE25475.1 acyl dehydratase [Paraburkholderia silvatlantica]